jgi:hypothetical protein
MVDVGRSRKAMQQLMLAPQQEIFCLTVMHCAAPMPTCIHADLTD